MARTFQILDLIIRVGAVIAVSTLGLAMLLLVSIMATDSGRPSDMATAAAIFVGGCCIIGLVIVTALVPEKVGRFIPGPSMVGKVLVRIPTYPFGTAGMFLVVRQIWQVAIPDLLR